MDRKGPKGYVNTVRPEHVNDEKKYLFTSHDIDTLVYNTSCRCNKHCGCSLKEDVDEAIEKDHKIFQSHLSGAERYLLEQKNSPEKRNITQSRDSSRPTVPGRSHRK